MRLVDGNGVDIPGAEIVLPVVEHQALGRGVEQAVFPLVQSAQAGPGLGGTEGGIHKCRGHAGGL